MAQKRQRNRSPEEESASDGQDEWTEDEDDSDAELQEAFAQGRLKPGLNYAADAPKEPVNNKERLLEKLQEIRLDLPWIERLDLTNGLAPLGPEIAAEIGIDPNVVVRTKKRAKTESDGTKEDNDPEELDNVDDDFKRELRLGVLFKSPLFSYRQAQAAVLEAIPRLHALGIPTRRPDDYFAEMAKSDQQMKKIREKLVKKQQSMELSEKAKKLREQRKYGKQVQLEVMKKRQEEKKKLAESVKKFRKGARGQQDELDFLTEIEGPSGPNARHQKGNMKQKGPMRKSGKQQYKESKYGFGGQKKRSKYNTKDSADDVGSRGGFNPKKHGASSSHRKGGKKPAQKRPGKVVRKKMHNQNKR